MSQLRVRVLNPIDVSATTPWVKSVLSTQDLDAKRFWEKDFCCINELSCDHEMCRKQLLVAWILQPFAGNPCASCLYKNLFWWSVQNGFGPHHIGYVGKGSEETNSIEPHIGATCLHHPPAQKASTLKVGCGWDWKWRIYPQGLAYSKENRIKWQLPKI